MDLVSVIIPSYNRFKFLLETIESIKNQTYKFTEIIVVNDCSTQLEYYDYDFASQNVKIIHLQNNTKKLFGYACAGHVRNVGIDAASGRYIAFCDDDDIWYPVKLEKQIDAMKKYSCKMSCTEGHIGNGRYDSSKQYEIYMKEHHYNYVDKAFKKANSNLLTNGFPSFFDLNMIKIHNLIVCSSVVVERDLLNQVGKMPTLRNGEEDHGCWLRLLNHTGCFFVSEPCFYYDNSHGNGQNY